MKRGFLTSPDLRAVIIIENALVIRHLCEHNIRVIVLCSKVIISVSIHGLPFGDILYHNCIRSKLIEESKYSPGSICYCHGV